MTSFSLKPRDGGLVLLGVLARLEVNAGQLSAGDITTFVGLSLILGASAVGIVDGMRSLARAADPLRRLSEPLNDPAQPRSAQQVMPSAQRAAPTIVIRDLHFAYGGGPAPAFSLRIDDLTIQHGTTVAFVGESGCGKSTLLSLIAGETRAACDAVRLSGVPINALPRSGLAEVIGYVEPTPALLARPLLDNIVLGRRVAPEQITAALEISGVGEVLLAQPDSASVSVNEMKAPISSGQRQRLGLARTLISPCRVLLLDEALSSLDAQTELDILERLRCMGNELTLIIASHRVSSVARADRIYVLRGGAIVESGTHDELVQQGTQYRALFGSQLDLGKHP